VWHSEILSKRIVLTVMWKNAMQVSRTLPGVLPKRREGESVLCFRAFWVVLVDDFLNAGLRDMMLKLRDKLSKHTFHSIPSYLIISPLFESHTSMCNKTTHFRTQSCLHLVFPTSHSPLPLSLPKPTQALPTLPSPFHTPSRNPLQSTMTPSRII
jgi:hypothetical protein